MPRPGPRPYVFERKAWHSDTHQTIRGSLVQEIFRVVNEIHSSSTKKNKEWKEKLPVVVLKAEEIMYSKANSEGEYMNIKTLWDRTNDAVNTIIRRDDSTETGKLLQPCIEGCTPRTLSSQRNCSPRCYLNSATQANLMANSHCLVSFTKPATVNAIRSSFESPKYAGRDGCFTTFAPGNVSLPNNNQWLPSEKCSVYPLYYYGNDLKSEDPRHGFGIFHKSAKMNQIGVRSSYNNPYCEISCDISLRLGPLSTPCLGDSRNRETKDTDSIIAQWNRSPAIDKRLSSFHKSNRYDPLNASPESNEWMNVDAAMRKRKMLP
ncbi:Detected protein of unknown function [Hibiscus syriacus]|uniref:Uncharacterized protein n=1 Tax=Hibiscus syriacus TaxID=106335 RepID=A0A6A2WM24_HIBSY|nr:Detected protein of unknown function [Hibiscus syriacus]